MASGVTWRDLADLCTKVFVWCMRVRGGQAFVCYNYSMGLGFDVGVVVGMGVVVRKGCEEF